MDTTKMQPRLESSNIPILEDAQNVKKAMPTLEFQNVSSDMTGREQKIGFQEWINLVLDRQCTPVLYVYFAAIAILGVITAGIIIIVGLQCNWNFVAI